MKKPKLRPVAPDERRGSLSTDEVASALDVPVAWVRKYAALLGAEKEGRVWSYPTAAIERGEALRELHPPGNTIPKLYATCEECGHDVLLERGDKRQAGYERAVTKVVTSCMFCAGGITVENSHAG